MDDFDNFFSKITFFVSRETLEKLKIYGDLLEKWQKKINLVSNNTIPNKYTNHFLDSFQLLKQIDNLNFPIIDLGSGAGFPGIILALFGCTNVTLIERNKKKCSFLKNVSRETKTNFNVYNGNIEDYPSKGQIIVCRGLANLDLLINLSHKLLCDDGYMLFLKGKKFQDEINNAKKNWEMTLEKKSSITSKDGVILKIKNICSKEK